ncbi:MAG: hypothetical protein WBV22_03685 [Anaerolineaceae bacterium]
MIKQAMQGSLVYDLSRDNRFSCLVACDRQPLKPSIPTIILAALDSDFIYRSWFIHAHPFPWVS